jgi:hypothetical protein
MYEKRKVVRRPKYYQEDNIPFKVENEPYNKDFRQRYIYGRLYLTSKIYNLFTTQQERD